MSLLPSECPNCGHLHKGHDFDAEPGPVQEEVRRLRRIEEAARRLKDGFPFLNGKPDKDFGGDWIPFVEALEEPTAPVFAASSTGSTGEASDEGNESEHGAVALSPETDPSLPQEVKS